MWGTSRLKPALETGVAAVKKADTSLRLCLGLVAATLVLVACTLVAVLVTRPVRA